MPTQPAPRPQPQAKAVPKDDSAKRYAIIGFGTVVVLVVGFFVLNTLMTEDRGGSRLVNVVPESKPVKKAVVDEAPVALIARPIRLFEEYVRAVQAGDKGVIRRYSEFDEAKLELLLTEERQKILTDSLQSKRVTYHPPKIEAGTATVSATYQNSRGFDVMGLELEMRQKGGPEDWVVTKVLDRWYATSGKMPESRMVELGGNRAGAARPLVDPATFKKLPEVEPKKLDWLTETPEAQRREIEGYINDLFDEKHPAKLSKASTALATMGKPAIPALLNVFIGLDLRKDDDIKKGNSVDRTLSALTDQEMGFDPANFQSAGAVPPAEGRMRAIRRWFGWWDRNKDQPLPHRNQPEEVK